MDRPRRRRGFSRRGAMASVKKYGPWVAVTALGVVLVAILAPIINPGVEKAQGWVSGVKGGSGSGSGTGGGAE